MRKRLGLLASAVAALSLTMAPAADAATKTSITVGFLYITPTITIKRGDTVKLRNLDPVAHTLTSVAGRFDTGLVGFNQTRTAAGVRALPRGSYKYLCTLHPFMKGTLKVT
jgi:plastocyanin